MGDSSHYIQNPETGKFEGSEGSGGEGNVGAAALATAISGGPGASAAAAFTAISEEKSALAQAHLQEALGGLPSDHPSVPSLMQAEQAAAGGDFGTANSFLGIAQMSIGSSSAEGQGPTPQEFLEAHGYSTEASNFPTEEQLTEQARAEATNFPVWDATSANGISGGQTFTDEEGKAWLEARNISPAEGHEAEQAQMMANGQYSQAVANYQDGSYHDINDSLRSGHEGNEETARQITNIDSAIQAQNPTTAATTLFRGAGEHTQSEYNAMPPGTVFTDSGYVSTSMERDTAESFSRVPGTENPNTGNFEKPVIAIHVPEGTKGLNVNGVMSIRSSESEILLPRGSSFEVLSHEGLTTHVSLIDSAGMQHG